MRVIDFHFHVGTHHNFNPWVMEYFKQHNPLYCERFYDEVTPEGILDYLQSQGVDRAVVLSEYAPQATGVVTNEFTAAFCRGHEELIPVGAPCLYSPTPLPEQAEYAVKELGVKGFKMLPSYSYFYPNDTAMYPFYEVARDLGVPLLFHTGTSIFKGTRIKYADPLLLDDVADDFPDLTIIMEHGGRTFWYDRAAWLIVRHPNMHVGTAGMPAKRVVQHFPVKTYPDRFLFGSDWPGIPAVKPLVDRILALSLDDEIKEMILWRNAARVLGLDGS